MEIFLLTVLALAAVLVGLQLGLRKLSEARVDKLLVEAEKATALDLSPTQPMDRWSTVPVTGIDPTTGAIRHIRKIELSKNGDGLKSAALTPPRVQTRFLITLADGEAQIIGRNAPDVPKAPDIDLAAIDRSRGVSRCHAKIKLSGGRWFIEDIPGVRNPTKFLGKGKSSRDWKSLTPGNPHLIEDGDTLRMGEVILGFSEVKSEANSSGKATAGPGSRFPPGGEP